MMHPYQHRPRVFSALACLSLYVAAEAASLCRPSIGFVVPRHQMIRSERRRRDPNDLTYIVPRINPLSGESRLHLWRAKSECVDKELSISAQKDETITTNDRDESERVANERTLGILILLTVPLAWGTYTPVVKYMYDRMDPSVPGFVFSAGYYLVAAGVLSALNALNYQNDMSDVDTVEKDHSKEDASTVGGLELGSYLFLGNGFQVVGLQSVPADRAAFLVQLTTVMVPLVSAWIGGKGLASVSLMTWSACIIAFLGVIIMGMDDNGQLEMITSDHFDLNSIVSSVQISQGDGLIILAALAYTMHVVRLGVYAPKTRPLTLAASKARTEAIFSVALVIALAFLANQNVAPAFVQQLGKEIGSYFDSLQTTMANTGNEIEASSMSSAPSPILIFIAAILWTGMITSAYTIYAQSFGQRRINPVDSNLIYTTQPLFSSGFAYILLDEKLGISGWIGAALIGVALGLVVFGNQGEGRGEGA